MSTASTPHYRRFAQALALVTVSMTASGCCPMIPDSIACDHCACTSTDRSLAAPVLCDTIRRDPICCRPIAYPPTVRGPLPPPNLVVA